MSSERPGFGFDGLPLYRPVDRPAPKKSKPELASVKVSLETALARLETIERTFLLLKRNIVVALDKVDDLYYND